MVKNISTGWRGCDRMEQTAAERKSFAGVVKTCCWCGKDLSPAGSVMGEGAGRTFMAKREKLQGIQGLRGVVAFVIAYVFHYGLIFQVQPVHTPILSFLYRKIGYYGLASSIVFFLLSGFLTMRSYEQRIAGGGVSLKEYMVPKIIRLYPVVIVTALAEMLLEWIGKWQLGQWPLHGDGGAVRYSLFSLILNMLGFQAGWISDGDTYAVNGPSWFVSILFICYLLFYLLTRLIRRDGPRRCVIAAVAVAGAFCIALQPDIPLLYFCNGRGYLGFFGGALIYVATERLSERGKQAGIVVSLAGMVLSFVLIWALGDDARELVLDICFWPAVMYLTLNTKPLAWIFSLRPFEFLGKISMSLFLCNIPTDTLINLLNLKFSWGLDYANFWVWVGHIAASLAIAAAVHYLVAEKAGGRLMGWWRKRRGQMDAVVESRR